MVPDDPCQVVRILGCTVGEHAGGGELCDDHSEFAVLLLRLTAQHPERLLRGQPESLHQHALRLPEHIPGVDGVPEVLLGPRV